MKGSSSFANMLAAPYMLEPVRPQDFESLLTLRIRALQPSLERLGVVTLRPVMDALQLDHLYVEPAFQSQAVGRCVMHWTKAQADARQFPLRLEALQRSDALRFYARLGFTAQALGEWDVAMWREPAVAPKAVVQALWAHFQSRDWLAALALLHEELVAHWWTSAERFAAAAAFIEANARYPEGWAIHPLHMAQQDDGRVLSIVRVDHLPYRFYATSLFGVVDGRILSIDECWAQAEEPPAWRLQQGLPGWSRFDAVEAVA